ncbi:MAG: efflux RND transporter periplasmic adaptor subunit [Planctomycetota bacterium]|nr:efflux RND transporter periplasmic adaptor subunit [Planctomycetota bacterium]
MHTSPFIIFSLAFFALLSTGATAQQVVIVEPVALASTQPTERFIGSLRARSTSAMAALEEGALLELSVREADTVKKGDVLARVDSRRLEMGLAQVQADLAMGEATVMERQANLANAEADLEALNRAADSGAVSERDLRNARTAVAVGQAMAEAARQSIASLQANRELLQLRIADATVRAPFDARVVARHAEIGQWIRPGDPLVTLVSTGTLEAWIEVPERHMGGFDSTVQNIALLAEGSGVAAQGSRPRTIPLVDERARTFTLILDVKPGAPGFEKLQPGMSISATVPLGQRTPHMVLAKDAILRRGTNSLVAKIGPENMTELVPVRILFGTDGGFAVEPMIPDSLKPGDRVVTEGNERLYPGTPVTPTERQPNGDASGDPAPSPAPKKSSDSK